MAAFVAAHRRGLPVALGTSGTSEAARSVVRSTDSWVRSFPHVTRLLAMTRESAVWVPGPMASTMNLFAAAHAAFTGARVVGTPAEATHVHLTPSRLRQLLDDEVDVSGTCLVTAGERLPRGLAARAVAAGARTFHYYGAAELSFVAWGTHEEDLRPFPEVEVAVRDAVVWARSPYLCRRYDGPPGPMQVDADGFATVGDRGELRDGRLLVHGRGEDAVTTGGATVQVADVEAVLRGVAAGELVLVGLPHAALGQVLAAVLTDPRSFEDVRTAARDRLSGPQRPRLWFAVDELPLTGAGKVDRLRLRELLVSPQPGVRRLT